MESKEEQRCPLRPLNLHPTHPPHNLTTAPPKRLRHQLMRSDEPAEGEEAGGHAVNCFERLSVRKRKTSQVPSQ